MTKKTQNPKQTSFGIGVLDFSDFGFIWPPFVSIRGAAFDIRISDFLVLARETLLKSFC